MKTTAKIAAIAAAGTAFGFLALFNSYVNMIHDRFPRLNKRTARKAYWNMMLNAMKGEYSEEQMLSDDTMDVIFMQEVRKIDPWV